MYLNVLWVAGWSWRYYIYMWEILYIHTLLMDSIFKFADWMSVGWEVRRRKMILHRNLSLVLKIVKGIIWLIYKCVLSPIFWEPFDASMWCGWRLEAAASPLALPWDHAPHSALGRRPDSSLQLLPFWPWPYPQTEEVKRWEASSLSPSSLSFSPRPTYHLLIVFLSTGEG